MFLQSFYFPVYEKRKKLICQLTDLTGARFFECACFCVKRRRCAAHRPPSLSLALLFFYSTLLTIIHPLLLLLLLLHFYLSSAKKKNEEAKGLTSPLFYFSMRARAAVEPRVQTKQADGFLNMPNRFLSDDSKCGRAPVLVCVCERVYVRARSFARRPAVI